MRIALNRHRYVRAMLLQIMVLLGILFIAGLGLWIIIRLSNLLKKPGGDNGSGTSTNSPDAAFSAEVVVDPENTNPHPAMLVIQKSTNLVNWDDVAVAQFNGTGFTFNFTNRFTASGFYRAKAIPHQ